MPGSDQEGFSGSFFIEQREPPMTDILRTLTIDEVSKAQELARDESQLANDCYQLMRYYRGQIFYRVDAERALKNIRGLADA